MKIIAHRGNTGGVLESYENEPTYIDLAIKKGFDVEIDIWAIEEKYGTQLWLGHDKPLYGIDMNFIRERIPYLWIHCKNIDAVHYLKNHEDGQYTNYFWHQNDDFTLTSFGFIWTYPLKDVTTDSVIVLTDKSNDELERVSNAYGICTDYAELARDYFGKN
jgi:hypothetical protein